VITRAEVTRVLSCLHGKHWLMASILYDSGLRLVECLRLRIQDIDFEYLQVTVRGGKGNKNRLTMLPESLVPHIEHQMAYVKGVLERNISAGRNGASTPNVIARKYKNATLSWSWQYLFPATRYAYITHNKRLRRHHAHSSGLSRAVKSAVADDGINERGGHAVRRPLDL